MKRLIFIVLLLAMFVGTAGIVSAQSAGMNFRQEGIASWYGPGFSGRPTASGEIFNPAQFTAAHPSLPFGTVLTVTNTYNNRQVRVRINDRGPFVASRIIDVSEAAARVLDMLITGTAHVIIESSSNLSVGPVSPQEFHVARPQEMQILEFQPPVSPTAIPPAEPRAAPQTMPQAVPQAPAQSYIPQQQQPQVVVVIPQQSQYQQPQGITPEQHQQSQVVVVPPQQQPQVFVPEQPPQAQPQHPLPQQTQPEPQYVFPQQQQPQLVPQQPLPPARILPDGLPALGTNKLYRIQVGSYRVPRHAVDVFEKLKTAGFSPAYERGTHHETGEDLYRVVLSGLRPEELENAAVRLGTAGFRDVLLREER